MIIFTGGESKETWHTLVDRAAGICSYIVLRQKWLGGQMKTTVEVLRRWAVLSQNEKRDIIDRITGFSSSGSREGQHVPRQNIDDTGEEKPHPLQ